MLKSDALRGNHGSRIDCASRSHARTCPVSPAGWKRADGQQYRDGAGLPRRFLERWGGTIVIPPIGMQDRLFAEQRRGADFGVAAVTGALGGDLGRCRLAGFGRAVVTWARLSADHYRTSSAFSERLNGAGCDLYLERQAVDT